MTHKFNVYGRVDGEWFFVDTFTTWEKARHGIRRLLKDFPKYSEFRIDEIFCR